MSTSGHPAGTAIDGATASMKAHVLVRPGQLEMREMAIPRAGDEGVVVRVRAALTCGTDLKTYLRGHPKFPMPMLFRT